MRVYYEKTISPIEQTYEEISTIENIIFLEDIIRNISNDICVQYKHVEEKEINYAQSNIILHGIIKTQNHLYFMKNHGAIAYNYVKFDPLKENFITIKMINSNLDAGNYTIHVYLNDVFIEEHIVTDLYSLYNRKYIKLNSEKLGTSFTIV